jgi:hypothetical protein
MMSKSADTELVEMAAGTLDCAQLPQPVPDRGGLRVDTAMPEELRRYVFGGPSPAITQLAQEIHAHMYSSRCADRARVCSRWCRSAGSCSPGYLMTKEAGRNPVPSLPPGYWLQVQTESSVTTARIFADDDTLAASGYAVEYEGCLCSTASHGISIRDWARRSWRRWERRSNRRPPARAGGNRSRQGTLFDDRLERALALLHGGDHTTFLTNSVFRLMAPKPSILQSIS